MYSAQVNYDYLKESFSGYRTGKKWELVFGPHNAEKFDTEALALSAIEEFKKHSPEITVTQEATPIYEEPKHVDWESGATGNTFGVLEI